MTTVVFLSNSCLHMVMYLKSSFLKDLSGFSESSSMPPDYFNFPVP